MGMFGNAMGAMVGAGGGRNQMQQRPGMPVQNQNPGMMGQNQNAMSGARTAQMRNPMNPGMGMGPSQQMQQKMGMMGQAMPVGQMGGIQKQAPQAGLPYGQPNQMHDMGPGNIPGRGGYGGGTGAGGMLHPNVEPYRGGMGGGQGQIYGGPQGQGFADPEKMSRILRGGGLTDMSGRQINPWQGQQPQMNPNGEAPEEVPGAEEQMNPQMQNLMSQYGSRQRMY